MTSEADEPSEEYAEVISRLMVIEACLSAFHKLSEGSLEDRLSLEREALVRLGTDVTTLNSEKPALGRAVLRHLPPRHRDLLDQS